VHNGLAPLFNRTRQQHKNKELSVNGSFSNNSNDKDDIDWISERVERASFSEICRDSVLVMCYVLCRFFIYDIATGIKSVPGWELQDLVYLTGTFSSAIVLVTYWTVAVLLSRRFENSGFNPIQTL
jgi:hypothetical protein